MRSRRYKEWIRIMLRVAISSQKEGDELRLGHLIIRESTNE